MAYRILLYFTLFFIFQINNLTAQKGNSYIDVSWGFLNSPVQQSINNELSSKKTRDYFIRGNFRYSIYNNFDITFLYLNSFNMKKYQNDTLIHFPNLNEINDIYINNWHC